MTGEPSSLPAPHGFEPVAQLHLGRDRVAIGATAAQRIVAAPERVWGSLDAMWRSVAWVPLIRNIRRDGDRLTVDMRLRLAVFSVGFQFAATVVSKAPRRLELRWLSGEPREMNIIFELVPDGEHTIVYARSGFDVRSLGWLTRLVLKHHPELHAGIHAGIALVLVEMVGAGVAAA